MVEIKHCRNFVYQTGYHLVWCPKYIKHVLMGSVAQFLSEEIDSICQEREIQSDHVRLFLSFPPSFSTSEIVKTIKGRSARKIFQKFPIMTLKFWKEKLCSPSYYVGIARAETIKRYMNQAEHIKNRH